MATWLSRFEPTDSAGEAFRFSRGRHDIPAARTERHRGGGSSAVVAKGAEDGDGSWKESLGHCEREKLQEEPRQVDPATKLMLAAYGALVPVTGVTYAADKSVLVIRCRSQDQ